MRELVGKTIVSVNFDFDTEDCIQFVTDKGEKFTYFTEGDCCSSSYFTDINGIPELIGSTVLSHSLMEEVLIRDVPRDFDEVQVYGEKLKTTGGYVDFIYHNSSNGYYGGSLELIENNSISGLKPLTGDFMAGDVFRAAKHASKAIRRSIKHASSRID